MHYDDWIDELKRLVIKQYYGKPNAMAEIEVMASIFKDFFKLFSDLIDSNNPHVLQLLSGIDRPPGFSDQDFLSLLRIILATRGGDYTLYGNNFIYGQVIRGGLQGTYSALTDGKAVVTDNLDGSITVRIDETFSPTLVDYLKNNNLAISASGIKVNLVSAKFSNFFGFEDNPLAEGFADKAPDGSQTGGGVLIEKKVI